MKVTISNYEQMIQPADNSKIGQRPERDEVTGEPIAWDRAEDDYCERGTQGCALHHTHDSECQTW